MLSERPRVAAILTGALVGFLAALVAFDLGFLGLIGLDGARVLVLALAAGAGAFLARFRRDRWLIGIGAAMVALYLLVAGTPLMRVLAGRWVRAESPRAADAIVVLTSSVTPDSVLDTHGTSRLLTGVDLLRQRHAPRLLMGRVGSDTDQRRIARLTGSDSVWRDLGWITSTRDEVVATAKLLPPPAHIIVVTTPMHTRRACAAFERQGFSVTCVSTPERDVPRWRPRTPAARLASFRAYLYEQLAWAKYDWNDWVP